MTTAELEQCHAMRDASGQWPRTETAADPLDAEPEALFQQTWTNAYNPWTAAIDEQLQAQWAAGVSITAIAEPLRRHPETIRARLALLGATGLPAAETDYAAERLRQTAPKPPTPRQVSPPTPYQLLDFAGVPFHLRARTWLELAVLIECGTCFADAGTECVGQEAIRIDEGLTLCPSRPEELPEIDAKRCPHCTSYLVERPWGWHETCWSHSDGADKAAFARERMSVWDERYQRDQQFLTVDVEAATQFWCRQCGVTPRTPCREVTRLFTKPALTVPEAGVHPARVRDARSHRRARNFLESAEPVGPFA